MIAKFRVVAIVEAVTYLVLLGGVVVKYAFDEPGLVRVLGPIHGVAFLVYLVLVLKVRESQGWKLGQTLLVIIAAAIPLGGFIVERRLVDNSQPALAG